MHLDAYFDYSMSRNMINMIQRFCQKFLAMAGFYVWIKNEKLIYRFDSFILFFTLRPESNLYFYSSSPRCPT